MPSTSSTASLVVPTTTSAAVTNVESVASVTASAASKSQKSGSQTATASSLTNTGSGGGGSTSESLSSADASKLMSLGFQAPGTNAQDSSGGVWIGSGGAYTTQFTNNHDAGIVLIVWGPDASWVNAHTPLITVSLSGSGGSTQISFADQQVGAYSALYPDTPLINGQVSNTWAEYTFNSTGVVDVSRLVNGTGYDLEVAGPDCTSNMNSCVFKCDTGNTCTTGYTLTDCGGSSSQSGAQDGTDSTGADSGGCGWNGASSASFKATFGGLPGS